MRKSFLLFSLIASSAYAQASSETKLPPNTVVATVNGRKLTAEDVEKMVAGTPTQVQQAFKRDPKQFLREYAWYTHLQDIAEKQGIDKQSPYKEVLEFQRMLTLVNATLTEQNYAIIVPEEQRRKYYDDHKDRFREVKAKLIYVPFSSAQIEAAASSEKKPLSEAEAKIRAEAITKEARSSGADFVQLVKQYSEDAASKGQDGDLGIPVRITSTQVPAAMRETILKLHPGEISDPVRHENGYYIFRAESAGVLSYDAVKDEIFKELKDLGFKEWQAKSKTEATIQFENEAFFNNVPK